MRIISASTLFLFTLTLTLTAQRQEVGRSTEPATFEAPHSERRATLHGGTRLDTFFTHMMRSRSLVQYEYPADSTRPNDFVPVTGTNTMYHALGQKYDFSGLGAVRGLLLGMHGKSIVGTPDTLSALVFTTGDSMTMDQESLIAVASITTDRIDTGANTITLTPVLFNTSAALTSDFMAIIQTRPFMPMLAEDRIGLFSNLHKDGRGEDRAIAMIYNHAAGYMEIVPLSMLFTMNGEPLDVDLAIIPIVEVAAGTSGADLPTIGSLTMSRAFPNPATDNTVVGFTAAQSGTAEIAFLDAQARTISTVRRDVVAGEAQHVTLDLSGAAAGSYYYVVTLGATSVAGTIAVVK